MRNRQTDSLRNSCWCSPKKPPQKFFFCACACARPRPASSNRGLLRYIDIIRRTPSHADQELLVRADIQHRHRAPSRPSMAMARRLGSRLINSCALLTLGLLLIIWLRSRWVVLTPRRAWNPSPSREVLGPLPFEVEWRVPVGCGFSGFFVEVALGFMLPLASSGSFRLLCGKCDEDFLTGQLTVKEADAIRKTWADESARTQAQTRAAIVIEHGEPCSIRRWPASDRPLWVISRTMTEGDLAPEQADCLRAADEVLPAAHTMQPPPYPPGSAARRAMPPTRRADVPPTHRAPHTMLPAVLPARRSVRGGGPAKPVWPSALAPSVCASQACAPGQVGARS